MTLSYSSNEKRLINAIPIDRWRNLYDIAIQIRDAAPWYWLEEEDSFAIEDQRTGWTCYTCVMGGMGTYFGINFFLGDMGYFILHEILDSDGLEDIEPILQSQDCLSLSFDSREELEKPERTLMKRLKIKLREPHLYPCFRRHEPGFWPWIITRTEAEFLERVLPVFLDTILALREKKLELPAGKSQILLQSIKPDGSVETRKGNAPQTVRLEDEPEKYTYDELALKRTMDQCRRGQQIWEIGYLRSPEAVQENKSSRPFFPQTLLLADKASQLVLDVDMYENESELFQSLVPKIQSLIYAQKTRPARIITMQEQLKRILLPALKPYGIQVSLAKSMKAWENAAHALLSSFPH